MLFKTLQAAALIASCSRLVAADPTPLTPGTVNEGSTMTITWDADTTGEWTKTTISLMTGSNLNMTKLEDIVTLDASTKTSYSWPVPAVTPNAAIYFFQFAKRGGVDPTWTTRWAIAGTDGSVTDPEFTTQPTTNDAIPWGNGALEDASSASSDSTTTGTAADASTTSASSATSSTTSSASPTSMAQSTSSTSSSSSSTSTTATITGSAKSLRSFPSAQCAVLIAGLAGAMAVFA